jgi:O-antigen/teichoic acid export membrane protein
LNTVRRIAKNTSVLLIGDFISKFLGFFFIMYTARHLGAEGFGILSFALALTGIFGIFTDLGLQQLTVREVARDRSLIKKYLGNITAIKIILAVITFGLIILFIDVMDYPEQTIRVVYLIASSIIFTSFTQMFNSMFQAFEKMEYISVGKVFNSILLLSGALFAVTKDVDVIGFAFLYFFASISVLGYSIIISAWKFVLPKIKVDRNFWKPTIKEALPFGISGVFITIYYWTDSVMLSIMQGNEVVGWYNAAYRIILVLLFIPSALNIAIFPAMSQFYISSEHSLRSAYEKYFKYMGMIGIPIGVGTTLLAPKIIMLIFCAEYAPSIIALQILVWSSVFIFISGTFGRLFESLNRQMIVTKVTGTCAVLNVFFNLLLIPKYSYIGASVATVMTELFALILCFIWSLRIGYTLPNESILDLGKIVLVSIFMGNFIMFFNNLNLFYLIFSSVLLYFIILFLFGIIKKEDLHLIRKIVSDIDHG